MHRRHVLNNLDPYVCLFETCETATELYAHSHTWLNHMREHTTKWRCVSKSHGSFSTSTKDEYLHHMESVHPGKLSPAQLAILADRNAKAAESLFESCPLCGITKPTYISLQDHIVGHLRGLALQSLPPSYDTGAGDEEGFDSDEQGSGSQRSRSTIRNDRDRKSQLASNDAKPSGAGQTPIARKKYPGQGPPKGVIRIDPDCAVCHGKLACECEAKDQSEAALQAEQRMMASLKNKTRRWAKSHTQGLMLETFRQRIASLQQDEQYEGGVPEGLKRMINDEWQRSLVKYPEVLDYYFSLIKYTLPPDDDPLVRDLDKLGKLRPLGDPDRDENEIHHEPTTDYNNMWPSKATGRY